MNNLAKGIASFDGETSSNMVAYCDPQNTWNGWAMPYIHENFIADLITRLTYEENSFTMEGEDIRAIEKDGEEIIFNDTIKPTIIEGEKYYYFGWFGLCFDFKALDNKKTRAVIVDIDGLVYDEDVEELTYGEIVEVLTLDVANEFVRVLSDSGVEHGIDSDRIILI